MKSPAMLIHAPYRTSSLSCRSRYGQCTHEPLPQRDADRRRWDRFKAEIVERIEAEREAS